MEWTIPCSGCEVTIRLRITQNDFGKLVEITCPKCGAKFQTVIIDKENLNSLTQNLNSAIVKSLENNEVFRAIASLREAGFEINNMAFVAEIIATPTQNPKIKSRVHGGRVKVGTFSVDDKKELKKFHIKLDDD